MATNALLFGWNRSIPGREHISSTHFEEFVGYMEGMKADGTIESYDIVFLNNHGGDLNGFFLIRGEHTNLGKMMSSDEWEHHMTRAGMHLEGSGAIRGVTGEMVMQRMAQWTDAIPD